MLAIPHQMRAAAFFLCLAQGPPSLVTAAAPDRPPVSHQVDGAALVTSHSQQRYLGDVTGYIDDPLWRIFEKPPGLGAYVTECPDCFYMVDVTVGITVPPPWTFSTPSCALVTIVEQYGSETQYELINNNVTVGNTSVPVEEGGPCANDPAECIANGASQGTFLLSPGNHSLTIRGFSSFTDYGVFRIDSLSCPSAPTSAPARATTRPTSCTKGVKGGKRGKGGKGGISCMGGGKGRRGMGKRGTRS